jgi:hypothetical protein
MTRQVVATDTEMNQTAGVSFAAVREPLPEVRRQWR